MTLPDREKRCGLQDEVLAGEYVLGALSSDASAELAKRMKTDRQFAATVRRWQENLAEIDRTDRRAFSAYGAGRAVDHGRRRSDIKVHRGIYGRFAIVSALWNSVRFWRLTTSAAVLWAAALLFAGF